MNDMSQVIEPKSDQLNADDMISGPMTVTIRDVKITPGSEQPVSIVLDGTDKFFRPCKSMSRVLVGAWGPDAKAYIGRSLTLYRDPAVKWGGLEVGGIRISHMSDIDSAKVMVLTATKGSRKPFKVMPLVMQAPATNGGPTASGIDWDGWFESFKSAIAQQKSERSLKAWRAPDGIPAQLLQDARSLIDERIAALTPVSSGFEAYPVDNPEDNSVPVAEAEVEASDHPATARADAIIDEVKAALAVMDVNSIESRERANIDAMPEDIAQGVRDIIAARKSEIKVEQEAAKKREVVE